MRKFGKLDEIETNLLALGIEPLGLTQTVAYAQGKSNPPPWIEKVPVDPLSYYFVGTSHNSDLNRAKKESESAAAEKAALAIIGKAGPPSRQYVDLIHQSANVVDTWFGYDPDTRTYRYSTLLRLSRAISEAGFLNTAPLPNSPYKLMLSRLEVKEDGGNGPAGWRFEYRINGSALTKIPLRNYDNKNEKIVTLPRSPVPVSLGRNLEIEVTGYRNTAIVRGKISLPWTAKGADVLIPVTVKNPIPLQGSFVFYFIIKHS